MKWLLTNHGGTAGQCCLSAGIEVINGRRVAKRMLKMSQSINATYITCVY